MVWLKEPSLYTVCGYNLIDFCLNSNLFVHLVDYTTAFHMKRVSKRALKPQPSHVSVNRRMQSLNSGVRRKLTNVVIGEADQQVTPTELETILFVHEQCTAVNKAMEAW